MHETIVAAAMIAPDGKLYTLPAPARHYNVAQHYMQVTGADNFREAKQGFVTNTGRYVGRKEARAIFSPLFAPFSVYVYVT